MKMYMLTVVMQILTADGNWERPDVTVNPNVFGSEAACHAAGFAIQGSLTDMVKLNKGEGLVVDHRCEIADLSPTGSKVKI